MAIIAELDEKAFEEWLKDRPEIIKNLAKQFPPNRLYRLKSSNQRVFPFSYSEDGTLTVGVSGEYNAIIFEQQVFGILPEDLEECDLPDKDEVLGSFFTEKEDIDKYLGKKENK